MSEGALHHTVIESIGVYLPARVVTARDLVKGCRAAVKFPIEEVTGIHSVRLAGGDEFSIDLAKKAVADCLSRSRHGASDIDLVVCCNISHHDGPSFRYSLEPGTSSALRDYFGLHGAVAFDVSNACPGMFTALEVVDVLIAAGAVERALVVSGEYISHLGRTAQLELESLRDPRLACLTLGDAGAAVILERASQPAVGFEAIELYTVGRYSGLCTARATEREHGGAVMFTHAFELTKAAVKHATEHALHLIERHGWSIDSISHIVPHQMSLKAMKDAASITDRMVGRAGWASGVTINNLRERGNTATTSHFVALMDNIRSRRIRSGDRIVFSIAGSGLTVGTALCTLDDLPDRVLAAAAPARRTSDVGSVDPPLCSIPGVPIAIESIGVLPRQWEGTRETVEMARAAGERCLSGSAVDRSDIGLLVFAGVYRSGFMCEPATASLIARVLGLNEDVQPVRDKKKTLGFDLTNGGVGFLQACYVAAHFVAGGGCDRALVVASEVENNDARCPVQPRGVAETGSAVLLRRWAGGGGFRRFAFRHAPGSLDELTTMIQQQGGISFVRARESPRAEDRWLELAVAAARELLSAESLSLGEVRWVVASQRSRSFLARLREALGVRDEAMLDVSWPGTDLFTSSLAYGLHAIQVDPRGRPGDLALLSEVGAGLQVACALYQL